MKYLYETEQTYYLYTRNLSIRIAHYCGVNVQASEQLIIQHPVVPPATLAAATWTSATSKSLGGKKLPQTHFTAVVWFFRSTSPVLFSNFYNYVLVEYIPQRLVKSKQSRSIIIRFLQFPQFFGIHCKRNSKSNESIVFFRLFARVFAARFIELITKTLIYTKTKHAFPAIANQM